MKRKSMLALLLAVSMTCSMTAATGAVAFASDDTATEESADDATADDADAADTEEASDDTTEASDDDQKAAVISSGVKTRILELAGGNIERVEAKTVFAAAREQDVAALDLVRRAGEYIGIGIASYINLLDPEKIVLAGGSVATSSSRPTAMRSTASETCARRSAPTRSATRSR